MRIIKRTFTLVLTLAVLLAGFSFPELQGKAKAETTATVGIAGTNDVGNQPDDLLQSGEWLYYLYGDEAIIAGYTNTRESTLVIPFYLDKHLVSGIGRNAFVGMESLRNITIHSLVTRIPEDAFTGKAITIIAYSGSYALQFAKQNGLRSKNRTNDNATYEFNSSVIDFAGFPKKAYCVEGNETIYISSDIASVLTNNDIVYLPEKSTDLHIFAYRVESKASTHDGDYILSTKNIDDITGFLDRIDFRNQELVMDTSGIVILNEGVTVDGISSAGTFSRGFESSLSVNVNVPLKGKISGSSGQSFSAGASITGKLEAKLSGNASIEVETFPVPGIKTADISINQRFGYSLGLNGSISASQEKVNLFKVPVRGGPFSFWFTVNLSVSVSGSITVTGGISGTLSLKKERGKSWKFEPSITKEEPRIELSVKVDVSIPVELYAELGVEIGSVGLALKFASVKFTPGIEATGTSRVRSETVLQCIDVSGSVYISVSASVGCLSVKIGKKTWSDLTKVEFTPIKKTLARYSFHLDNTSAGFHYKIVDRCLVSDRTIVFKRENGESDYVTTASAGQWATPPKQPSKTGLIFDGWFFSPTQSGLTGSDFKWDFEAYPRLPYLSNLNSRYVFYAKYRTPDQAPTPYGEYHNIDDNDDDVTWHPEPPKPVEVSGITLNKTDAVLHVDGQYKDKLYLYAVVSPANADDTSVTWSSSNPEVATVDSNGVVSALTEGTTIITCTSNMTPSVSATCKVTVFQPVYVNSITLDKTSVELWANEAESSTLQLNATVEPANATYSSVHWSSSDEDVAWVDGWGRVMAISAGTATITCRSIKNQNITATCNVTVHQHVSNVYVTASQDGILPTETVQLSALCYPTNADNKTVNWTSSDNTVATVNASGLVTAHKYGDATITAAATDGGGASGSYALTVEHELTLISDAQNDTLYLDGENSTVIGYAYATQGSVRRMIECGYDLEWSLVNGETAVANAYMDVVPTIYTVSGKDYEIPSVVLYSGELHEAGNATFTLQCKAGPYTATTSLTVAVSGEKLAKTVALNPSKFELGMGEVAHIPTTPTATDGGILPQILSVNLSGDAYFNAHAHLSSDDQGICVWFPESGQYSANVVYQAANISYSVPVTFEVRDADGVMHLPVTSVTLSDSFVNMVVGDTYQLSATALPADAYDHSVTWISEDTNIATVSDNGKVTAKARGMVYIYCEANDGSGCYDTCVLNIEPFMALNETAIEKTIYLNGQTNVSIDSCSLTYQSAIRIENAGLTPNWTLRRISGDATGIALNEFASTAEGNVRVEGEEIVLLRANHTGVDQYQLVCEAGDYSASCDITLTVVEGDELPASITLITDSYEAEIGEEIEIDTAITCMPGGTKLPEDVNITIDPSRGFWNAMEDGTYFADFHCTFAEAGEYTAELVYSGANYRYAVPFTVRVKDETGAVPVAVQDIVMSDENIQLLVGDSFQLSASVLPADAVYGSITWSSFDTSIATVSANGKVTAMDAGITYVIASSERSDCSAICLITVEDGLTLENDSIVKTVYVDGATRTALDTVFLTESSSKRLTSAPEWKLQRVSGNNLTLRCSGTESANETGDTLYGCNIILYSVSAEGQTIYDLICSYGNERATMRIVVNAVGREGNAPASIVLSQTSYEAEIGELIVVRPEISCWPSGTQLPEGTRVKFIGNRQFLEAVNQQDWFVSQSISTFSFNEAGRYEANCVYSYSNISYTIPITFNIKDNNGSVPIHGIKMSLNTTALQMIVGDEGQLEAVFTPADVTDRNVTWKSNNTNVATVDASGRVKAKANGTAQITCTPSDPHCSAAICYVTVEDYLTVETGNTSYSCYLEGKPENLLSSAWLSIGTQQRLNRDNIVPVWTLTTTSGNSAVIAGTPERDGSAIRASTVSLASAGTTQYSITCIAGEYQWSQSYSVIVNSAGAQAPERVTLVTPEVNLAVGEVKTIDFTPVCQPSGTSLPQGIISTYVGLGAFYDALDHSVYERNGDRVTVAFTEPGRYLLTRVYRVLNLDYTALCVINVGSSDIDEFGLLSATEQECTIYLNGKSGAVSTISINDSTVYERYGSEIQWRVERLSGESITAGLVANDDTATLFVGDAEKVGADVWRVSCSFGSITDYVDVTIEVKEARKPIPASIELSQKRIPGVTGDWLYLPLGVKCSPEGSALPETGDDFWRFSMTGGLGEDVSESKIENGMLAVCFSESGYYSGTLVYTAGTISYKLPVYFTIRDEESQIDAPDQLKVWVLKDSDVIYPEGDVDIPIATAVVAESLNSYYAGTMPSYVEEKGISWSIAITSGNAVTLDVQRSTANTSDVVLKSIRGAGDVEYTVSCTIDGQTYTGNGSLHVASSDEARPDVTLIKSRYQVTQGIPAEISRMLYQRSTGGSLQAAGDWNVGSALAAIGYTYETTEDSWKVTFYKQGEYSTTVSTYVGNLRYDLPLVITVNGYGTQEQLRTLKLPSALTLIEEEAFSGLTVQVIDLRGTKVKTIESNAFKNCVDLVEIYIPSSVTSIASNAFYGCLNVTIHCVQGSSADRFATANGIRAIYDLD